MKNINRITVNTLKIQAKFILKMFNLKAQSFMWQSAIIFVNAFL